MRSVLDVLESRYPMLRGTIREHVRTGAARSYASSRANRTSRTTRRMRRYRTPLRPARSPS